ncbi:MAG: hypothetical protein WCI72_00415 [archaeon]
MVKNIIYVLVLFSLVLFSGFVLAENETLVVNSSIQNETNLTGNLSSSINETIQVSDATINLKNFLPGETKLGDVQLSINVQNIGDKELTNLYAFVSGDGFSSYDVIPIDSLRPSEKSYILVSGNFKKSGAINLTLKINQEVFYRVVKVFDDSISIAVYNTALASNLSNELSILKVNYSDLESNYQIKKNEGYDVSGVSLSDLKIMLRDAQANLLSENLVQTKVKLDLAQEEYQIQLNKMSNLSKVSLAAKLKDNAVLFSTLAGAIITFFTLYELLKRKKENIKEKIKSIQIKDKAGNSYSVKTTA